LNFYNIEKTKIARIVPIQNICAFTKSIDPKNLSFVVHFEQDYDYVLSAIPKDGKKELEKRGLVTKIMNVVQYAFAKTCGYNLPIY
jgi:hypothetical protein